MSTFYEFRMGNAFARYGVPENAVRMFKAFEEFRMGRLDEAGLGRLIRTSPANRASLVETLHRCLDIMATGSTTTTKSTTTGEGFSDSKYCAALMKSCTEMIGIADKTPPHSTTFPFMKLPRELRDRVYGFYIDADRIGYNDYDAPVVYPKSAEDGRRASRCTCPQHEQLFHWQRPATRAIAPALVSKQMHDEFLGRFYSRCTIEFACGCEMYRTLKHNELLRGSATHISFHWNGRSADKGIAQLGSCGSLRELTVTISRRTTQNVTNREELLARFFGPRGISSSGGLIRGGKGVSLGDARGFDELIALRGLEDVHVRHVARRVANRRSDDEKAGLQSMLDSFLLMDDDEGQSQGHGQGQQTQSQALQGSSVSS